MANLRLFAPWKFKRYKWFSDVLEAKKRYEHLSTVFDTFSAQAPERLQINGELEVLDHFFDWLQID